MLFMLLSVMLVKEIQPLKALSPIFSTLSNLISFKLLQFSKAELPMNFIFSKLLTFTSDE